ncbi:MAG TPA: aminoacyl-tRNA hydrolase [Anaerolineae bacterium]|nr:aminoacyl-tRNA hydrolase [Anaerolineae bacterium]
MNNMKPSQTSELFLIVGLGNPGREHLHNRHNVGFMVVDRLASLSGSSFNRLEFQSILAEGMLEAKKLILCKPQTFMNVSGTSVAPLIRHYDIPLPNVLVISDDIDLPLGQIRLRPFGGTGGHKGLQSIQDELGSQEFPRLRIGIGRPSGKKDPADFVLENFTESEYLEFEIDLKRAVDCVISYMKNGIEHAMTNFNRTNET